MNHDQVRETLEAQISALVKARRETTDAAKKAAATTAIEALQDAVDAVDIAAADQLGPRVNAVIEKLEEVQAAQGADAISSLRRSIETLRGLAAQDGGTVGNG